MGVLSCLEPERVFYYFEEICKIPHGSYHEEAISDYLVQYAKEHGFYVVQDSWKNVIMRIPASPGYEEEPPLILQGHMDMVCVKNADAEIDLCRQGLQLAVDGDFIYAKDTSLGGDDGIAVAYMLAIAEDPAILHPELAYIITVSEEVGMEGARNIDLSMLKATRMLNLDSEEEGVYLTSCAGGLSTLSRLPVEWEPAANGTSIRIEIRGLQGGHSGCEIHKQRGNAIRILARVLFAWRDSLTYRLTDMGGGEKDNAIPVAAYAQICLQEDQQQELQQLVQQWNMILKKEYEYSDPAIQIAIQDTELREQTGITEQSMDRLLAFLMALPEGVQRMSPTTEGLVETSLNLGILRLEKDCLTIQHSVRSSVTSRKYYVAAQIRALATVFGGETEYKGDYPAWEYREHSAVRERAVRLYEKLYGRKPVTTGIHAGLECGILAGKISELDCISMGPDIYDIHTTKERLSVSSTRRVYEWLIEFLKYKDGE